MINQKLVPQIEDFAGGDLLLAAQALNVDLSDPDALYQEYRVTYRDPMNSDLIEDTKLEKNQNFDPKKLMLNCNENPII